MDISQRLVNMGMFPLERNHALNDFCRTIVLVVPELIQDAMVNGQNLSKKPDICIIRWWKIINEGDWIIRNDQESLITYTLLYFHTWDLRFCLVPRWTWERVKGVLWTTEEYKTMWWDLFTAKKYK